VTTNIKMRLQLGGRDFPTNSVVRLDAILLDDGGIIGD
jgi:hypothetical protein